MANAGEVSAIKQILPTKVESKGSNAARAAKCGRLNYAKHLECYREANTVCCIRRKEFELLRLDYGVAKGRSEVEGYACQEQQIAKEPLMLQEDA
ncbi:hypothetical protein Y032_1031g3442 [Ancylostoma ceylanicum]|uniref:Uncharacterized protein n=1 Tax=Ancylostoma ceylanicum TaxID=53326 RepID=A0A016W7J7_9BILA|nr:hypothetical protein Y032_1031g3442 [Ancylostoma ceylanicum]